MTTAGRMVYYGSGGLTRGPGDQGLEECMKTYVILNARGMVIGVVTAMNPVAAVRKWNRSNVRSNDVAVDCYAK